MFFQKDTEKVVVLQMKEQNCCQGQLKIFVLVSIMHEASFLRETKYHARKCLANVHLKKAHFRYMIWFMISDS